MTLGNIFEILSSYDDNDDCFDNATVELMSGRELSILLAKKGFLSRTSLKLASIRPF